ncbi:SseB family protein [Streptomyces sp. NPDC008313]|uniref:SseB family protein n=1 Tax=Streptomyces sp. NPDC008313 TaxID=3364826 RepID=UPI0036E09B76
MSTDGGADGGDTDLVAAVRRSQRGLATPQDVFAAFLTARVYCERPSQPGFLTVDAPPSPGAHPRSALSQYAGNTAPEEPPPTTRLLPVFTSLEQFGLYVGEGPYFSTTGADVLGLLPPGLDIWLDPAADHSVRLASSAVELSPVLNISYRDRDRARDRDRSGAA